MKTVAITILSILMTTIVVLGGPDGERDTNMDKLMHRLVDFSSAQINPEWRIVNDDVMGGRSTSTMRIVDAGCAEFSGVLSLENNGGFASTRSTTPMGSLESYDGLILRVKGDGRSYQFRLRTSRTFDGIAYQKEFPTNADEWVEVMLPFNEFVASYRGRLLPDLGPVAASKIHHIGVLIADKQPGPFRLAIEWIAGYHNTDISHENTDTVGIL